MQIREVADVLGVDKKEVITEVENLRDKFEAAGVKVQKKLTAASALAPEVAAQVMANFDIRAQQVLAQEEKENQRRHREEEERRRAAEELDRKKLEEERLARAEAARKQAEAELARRQAEAARIAAENAARQEAEAKAQAAAQAAAAPPPPPVADQPPPPPAPAAPPAAPPARPATPPSIPRVAPGTRVMGEAPPQRGAGPGSVPQHRPGQPQRPGGRPGDDRYPPRTGPRTDQPGMRREGGPPPRREGGPPQQRRDGAPGSYPRREGGPPTQRREGGPSGNYPPRRGGEGQGPGRGPRGEGREGRDGRPSGPADANRIQKFLDTGMESDVVDEYKKSQVRRPKPAKAIETKTYREKEKEREDAARRRLLKPGEEAPKRIRPSQIFNLDGMTNDRRGKGRRRPGQSSQRSSQRGPSTPEVRIARFTGDFTLGEFADKTGIAINEVMGKLIMMGKMLTINHIMEPDLAEELALEFNAEIIIARESDETDVEKYVEVEENEEDLRPRPPVVTVMGHVDHGKTSLLDAIRKADVAASEHGGITQHIGAYHVSTEKGDIVFLDTPGHEAFTEMRSRGANITDLVVLVVAANDGVMPQTVEAINHAKAAEVPILVAMNKIDVEGANPDRVRQELMKYELVPEEYGGDTIMIPVSAITKQGLDTLLEYIALQTEVMELKANPNRPAVGTIVESHKDPLRGAVATILVEEGTLRVGDCFVAGTESGRIRSMRDDRDKAIEEAGPASPVEILGISGSPAAGERFVVVPSEAEAREIADKRRHRRKTRGAVLKQHINLDNLKEHMTEGNVLQLNIILKADVQGSMEAVSNSLLKIKSDKVLIKILHAGVGAVSASDVQLADASEAIILAFNVGVEPKARDAAEETGVDIRSYRIIYALLEDIEKAMMGMLAPEYEEKEEGRAKVQQTFKVSKVGTVAGCLVEEGTVAANHHARLVRDGAVIWRGKLKSLRRVKDNVKEVLSGVECGIGLEGYNDVKEGDYIETYSLVEQAVSLVSSEENKKPVAT